jgi:predicted O-methyltransferase YrrM
LFETVRNTSPKKILEIGTGIGYSTYIMKCAAEDAQIDTIEMELDHCLLARKYLREYKDIEVHHGEAASVLPLLHSNSYDLVFYDGYAPRVSFLLEYERLLKKGGTLLTANNTKKGVLTRDGSRPRDYQELLADETKWKLINSFGDTNVYQKLF